MMQLMRERKLVGEVKKYPVTKKHLERMRLPKVYWHCTLAEIPKECSHKEIVQRFCSGIVDFLREGAGLLFWGDYSHGKTGCAAIILKVAASQGRIGLFLRAPALSQHIIEKTPFDQSSTLFFRALEVPILVLDELILRGDDKYRETVIEDLLRERTNAVKSTIITSNLSPKKMKDLYPALAAVMMEAVLPVKVEGYDFRESLGRDLRKDLVGE